MNNYRVYYKDSFSIGISATDVESAKFKANLKTGRPNIDIRGIQYLGIKTVRKEKHNE